jgi:hypothetical protein
MAEEEPNKTYLSVPLQIMMDVQLGPDGHPWIRMQFGNTAMVVSLVFPIESSEEIIANVTKGIREAAKSAFKRQADTIPPDFTGIKDAWKN